VTRDLVARVVAILYLTAGRPFSPEVIDAWTVSLDVCGDGPDALTVARAVARTERHATVADYYAALTDHRARRPAPPRPELPEPPEPPLTDAQRDRNAEHVRACLAQLAGRLTDVERRPSTRKRRPVTPSPVPRRLDEDHYRRLAETDEQGPPGTQREETS
jgi:hypothetical protein